MAEWSCFKCKEKMVEDRVLLRYLDFERPLPGIKCPTCGVGYFLEQMVIKTIRKMEEMLEAK